jgi:hypothetical protein
MASRRVLPAGGNEITQLGVFGLTFCACQLLRNGSISAANRKRKVRNLTEVTKL